MLHRLLVVLSIVLLALLLGADGASVNPSIDELCTNIDTRLPCTVRQLTSTSSEGMTLMQL
jgi:hypothetical protein